MCGEIEQWQIAKTVFVRLTTTGAQQLITFNNKFERVEQVWIDECQITGFNGGVSGGSYLNVSINGMHSGSSSNESKQGVLLMVDVLNPHTTYQRPRVVAQGHQVTVTSMKLSLTLPTGAAATFTEACFALTFVCRKSSDELEEVRRLRAQLEYPPSIRDGMVRSNYQPN